MYKSASITCRCMFVKSYKKYLVDNIQIWQIIVNWLQLSSDGQYNGTTVLLQILNSAIIIPLQNNLLVIIKTNGYCSHASQSSLRSSSSSYSQVNIVKKNTKSPVWSYFGLKANENGCVSEDVDQPVCCESGKVVPAKGGNTSNLFWHLKEHHHTSYDEISLNSRKRAWL